MEISRKLFGLLLIGIMAIFTPSCSGDEETSTTVYYSMGFDTVSTTDLSELSVIELAYKEALGVSDTSFSLDGKISECDSKVLQSCRAAEEELKSNIWNGSYTFIVTNLNTAEVIYQKDFE